jgi:hypothetical protein
VLSDERFRALGEGPAARLGRQKARSRLFPGLYGVNTLFDLLTGILGFLACFSELHARIAAQPDLSPPSANHHPQHPALRARRGDLQVQARYAAYSVVAGGGDLLDVKWPESL